MVAALASRSGRDIAPGPSGRRSKVPPVHVAALRLVRFGLLAGLRRPVAVLTSVVLATGGFAIANNALNLQKARHPAPIFAKAEQADAVPRRAEPVRPLPPTRPLPAPPAPAPAPVAPVSARAMGERDAIGDLLRGDSTGSTAQRGAVEPQRPVAFGQRALTKLGYGPLKADGVMGAGTRQAIERFERDRHLGVTGALGPRTVRELAARSGLSSE